MIIHDAGRSYFIYLRPQLPLASWTHQPFLAEALRIAAKKKFRKGPSTGQVKGADDPPVFRLSIEEFDRLCGLCCMSLYAL